MSADKIVVVMSTSVSFLTKLNDACGGGGIPAAPQRRSHEGNVTWFQFILDCQEDGRLVPKLAEQRQLNVCHVWLADSFVAMETDARPTGWSYTVRLPRKSPDSTLSISDVFGVALKIDSTAQYGLFVRSFNSETEGTLSSTSASNKGSPIMYKTFIEVNTGCSGPTGAAAGPTVCIREVLSDVHLFLTERAGLANNAKDGVPTVQEQLLVIEYAG